MHLTLLIKSTTKFAFGHERTKFIGHMSRNLSRNQAHKSTLVKHILSYLRIMAEAEEAIDYQEEEYYEGEEYLEGEEGQQAQGEAVDPELMKKRVAEMEEELDQLTKVQLQVEKQISSASDSLDENSM